MVRIIFMLHILSVSVTSVGFNEYNLHYIILVFPSCFLNLFLEWSDLRLNVNFYHLCFLKHFPYEPLLTFLDRQKALIRDPEIIYLLNSSSCFPKLFLELLKYF